MTRYWLIAVFTVLAACHSGPPTDCGLAWKQANKCINRFHNSGRDREMLLACFPFSKPERMAGAWAAGFELNSFLEGKRASPDLLKGYLASLTPEKMAASGNKELVFDQERPSDGRLRIFQIDFLGRRETCPLGPNRDIVVDRVLSRTLKGVIG